VVDWEAASRPSDPRRVGVFGAGLHGDRQHASVAASRHFRAPDAGVEVRLVGEGGTVITEPARPAGSRSASIVCAGYRAAASSPVTRRSGRRTGSSRRLVRHWRRITCKTRRDFSIIADAAATCCGFRACGYRRRKSRTRSPAFSRRRERPRCSRERVGSRDRALCVPTARTDGRVAVEDARQAGSGVPDYKLPRRFEIIAELPRNGHGQGPASQASP